jgi:hypothetical protein
LGHWDFFFFNSSLSFAELLIYVTIHQTSVETMSNLKKGKEVRDRERAKNKGRGTGGGKKFSIENEDELAIRNRVHGDDDDDDEEEEEKPKVSFKIQHLARLE